MRRKFSPLKIWEKADSIQGINLKTTNSSSRINRAVHSKNWREQMEVTSNPHLTEEQCRHLYNVAMERQDPAWRGRLAQHRNFSQDLLKEMVLTERNKFTLGIIAKHPKADTETKVMAALKGALA